MLFVTRYKMNVPKLVADCYGTTKPPKFLETYLTEVFKLEYADKPDYIKLKKIFTDRLQKRDPTKTLEWVPSPRVQKVPLEPISALIRLYSKGGLISGSL